MPSLCEVLLLSILCLLEVLLYLTLCLNVHDLIYPKMLFQDLEVERMLFYAR